MPLSQSLLLFQVCFTIISSKFLAFTPMKKSIIKESTEFSESGPTTVNSAIFLIIRMVFNIWAIHSNTPYKQVLQYLFFSHFLFFFFAIQFFSVIPHRRINYSTISCINESRRWKTSSDFTFSHLLTTKTGESDDPMPIYLTSICNENPFFQLCTIKYKMKINRIK